MYNIALRFILTCSTELHVVHETKQEHGHCDFRRSRYCAPWRCQVKCNFLTVIFAKSLKSFHREQREMIYIYFAREATKRDRFPWLTEIVFKLNHKRQYDLAGTSRQSPLLRVTIQKVLLL